MKANYKNWVPKDMIYKMGVGTLICVVLLAAVLVLQEKLPGVVVWVASVVLALVLVVLLASLAWAINAYHKFSYTGKRQLSREIIEGTAAYVNLPEGGKLLEIKTQNLIQFNVA